MRGRNSRLVIINRTETPLDITTFSGCAQVLVRSVAGQTGPVSVTVGPRTLRLE